MPVLHTLGPAATDSATTAQKYCGQKNPKAGTRAQKDQDLWTIKLHPSFKDLYSTVDKFPGDYCLIPAAYSDQSGGWGDYHYRLLDRLDLVDAFVAPLIPLVVAHKPLQGPAATGGATGDKLPAYTHRATVELLKSCGEKLAGRVGGQFSPVLCSSKVQAAARYKKTGGLVITSQNQLEPAPGQTILAKYEVKMAWTVYRIRTAPGNPQPNNHR